MTATTGTPVVIERARQTIVIFVVVTVFPQIPTSWF